MILTNYNSIRKSSGLEKVEKLYLYINNECILKLPIHLHPVQFVFRAIAELESTSKLEYLQHLNKMTAG